MEGQEGTGDLTGAAAGVLVRARASWTRAGTAWTRGRRSTWNSDTTWRLNQQDWIMDLMWVVGNGRIEDDSEVPSLTNWVSEGAIRRYREALRQVV